MRRYTSMKYLPAALLLSGCLQSLLDEGDGLLSLTATEAGSSSASSTGEPSIPTTSAGTDVQTLTGDQQTTGPGTNSSGDPGSSSSDGLNLPPTIELFAADDDYIDAAGPLTLTLAASDDHAVIKVRLYLDGEKLADLTPADFPYAYDVLSAKLNGDARIFKVVVEDAEGLTAEKQADPVKVWLPASGSERCIFTDPGEGAVVSSVSALKYTSEAILAVGTRDTGAGPRLTVWKLDPNDCGLRPGWPKSMTNWSTHEGYKDAASIGTAVDLDEDGNIVVAGNFWVGTTPQGYVALLTADGSRLWEKAAQPGEEITSVAAATAQFKDRVFVGGALHTSNKPVRTDGAVWVYQASGETAFVSPPNILAAPFTPDEQTDEFNQRSEWVRAILIQPSTGNAIAVGEREFMDDGNKIYRRAFTVQVQPLGLTGTPWTSWAPSFKHDAAYSIALCGDDVLAAGWTRDEPANSKPRPMIFWLENDGSSMKHRDEPQMGLTGTMGLACDREAKIFSAATRDTGSRDAQVFTVPGQNGPPTWYEKGVAADDRADAAACDWRGFCGWGGYRTTDGKRYAVVRVHHP